jgi:hypothetical protein
MWILGVFVAGFIYNLLRSDDKGYSIHEQNQQREKEMEKEWLKKIKQEKENEENQKWR